MQIDRLFDALASAPRRKMLAFLSAGELTTSELAERFGMSAPTVSRHLSVLENAGLVSAERRGQFVYYRLEREHLANTLSGFVFEICPVGRPLKREAERRAGSRRLAPAGGRK
jgi:DNA-binding transcriptional ArsR family regulator